MKIEGHENTGCVFCDKAAKKVRAIVEPEDVIARASVSLTFEQAKEFLRLHEETIKDAMREAANGAIVDILADTEVLL